MSSNFVALLYLVAGVLFILALRGLSSPETSRRGNYLGMAGMAIAVLTTAALIVQLAGGMGPGLAYVLLGLLVGGAAGAVMAQRVEMTKMPELVAFMHSMIGLAAVFIVAAEVLHRVGAQRHAGGGRRRGACRSDQAPRQQRSRHEGVFREERRDLGRVDRALQVSPFVAAGR